MGISLTDKNRITAPVGGIREAVFILPSFMELRPAIRRLLEYKIEIRGTKIVNRTIDEQVRFFDENCEGAEKIPTQQDNGVVELASLDGWKGRIPPNTKMAVAAVFDESLDVEIEESEVFGGATVIRVDAGVGEVQFFYPSIDDPKFHKELKTLLSDRTRRRGRRVESQAHQTRMKFFQRTCQKVEGLDDLIEEWKDQIPENWVAASCRAFEEAEGMSEEYLGNS